MKKFWTILLAVMVLTGLTSAAVAQQKDSAAKGGKPGAVIVEVIKLTGTVKAVDLEKKTVSVEGSGGRTVLVNAKNARNLDQVKVGDKVNLEFIEELALFVRKSDAAPSAAQAQVVELAPKGQKPAGLMAETIELTGNVESVDSKMRTIAVKGPAGNIRTFKVDKAVKNFGQIKKGDQVVLRFTEAVALSVVKP
jgi:ribosomal 50S subunit-recycling heat shock protein